MYEKISKNVNSGNLGFNIRFSRVHIFLEENCLKFNFTYKF